MPQDSYNIREVQTSDEFLLYIEELLCNHKIKSISKSLSKILFPSPKDKLNYLATKNVYSIS